MRMLFPPGDTTWKDSRIKSNWREFNFMFNQIKRAIEPDLSMHLVFNNWQAIASGLAESPRKRKGQISKIKLQARTS